MKLNAFVVNGAEDVNECGVRDALGHRAINVYDTEEEIVQSIDDQGTHPDKLRATQFLKFLGNRRLTLEAVKLLPVEEQQRLRNEFRESD